MPLYEYECECCGHRFEVIQRFSDAPVQTCPSCGGAVRKLLSSPAIHFKGTGWYITDYARKPSGDAKSPGDADQAKTDAPAGGDKSSPSSDSPASSPSASPAAGASKDS